MSACRLVGQVALAEGTSADERQAAARALTDEGASVASALRSHAGAHLDLAVGGGDLTWDLLFEEGASAHAFLERANAGRHDDLPKAITKLELAAPQEIAGHLARPGLVGVKRTLWLRVEPGTDRDALARFEAETPLLARAVPAIRNWRWSRVPAESGTRWTHLWEQEFDSVDGLQVDYMSSPAHWGYIDRWFDPEMPERIVDLWLAHLACPETEPVLSWTVSS